MAWADQGLVEPDWQRLPGFRSTTVSDWNDVRWQRAHSAKSVRDLSTAFGPFLDDQLAADIAQDQTEHATMALLIPPHMLNTMNEHDLWHDPVRAYMAPASSEREPTWPTHPLAMRDSLRERDMWAVEGLTHRYPQKVLAELVQTCPQYCGHCTRMDLVGGTTAQVTKYRFATGPRDRLATMLAYLQANPQVSDLVVSGGDVANTPISLLEQFVRQAIELPNIREVRLATKALVGLPQHFFQSEVLAAFERLAAGARVHGVNLSVHTHANHAHQVTPSVVRASRALLDLGMRDVRNQAVLLRGVNATVEAQLALCERLLFDAGITPYYVYMCDMVPGSEHWRTPLWEAQEIQQGLMGRLPGYATPRVVCDVPLIGKKWVHQADAYDIERGISTWSKRYATPVERDERSDPDQRYCYYDPIHTLGETGQRWWAETGRLAGVVT